MKRVEDKMSSYQTSVENFNKNIVSYLEEIKTEEIKRNNRYDFGYSVKEGGRIYCFTFEEKDFRNFIFMNSISCSKTIEDELKSLTNY